MRAGYLILWAATSAAVATEPGPDLLRAAFVVAAHDHYAARCGEGRGFSASQSREIKAWERTNDVPGVRRHLAANPLPPHARQQIDAALQRAYAQIDGQAMKAGSDACAAALALTRTPEARLAGVTGQPVSGDGVVARAPAAAGQAARPQADPAGKSQSAAVADTRALAAQIDRFGFDTRPKMGAGGFIGLDIYPVVLFKDGSALTDVKRLAEGGTLATLHQRQEAGFTRWRRSGGEWQVLKSKGWEKLKFQQTYGVLPAGFALDGLYRASGGTGTLAVGGTSSVSVWRDYRFTPDGQVTGGGGAGGRAEAGQTSVVTGSSAAGRSGRYRVDGLMLHIDWADGSREHRILITDPKDARGAIWLDGRAYVQRKQ